LSISWGIKERFRFIRGGMLFSWNPPTGAGIYAITYRRDPERPKLHTILFVGQGENLAIEAPPLNGQVLDAWKNSSHDVGDLHVFVHPMPGSSTGERFRVQEQLIEEYRPQCNR